MERLLPAPNSGIDRKKARVPKGRFPCCKSPGVIAEKLLERSDQFFSDNTGAPPPAAKKKRPLFPEASFEIRWSQRADSRMPSASAASGAARPRTLAGKCSRICSVSRPYRFESPSLTKKKGPHCWDPYKFDGANERIRTADLRITSALLYQLSHVGVSTSDYVT